MKSIFFILNAGERYGYGHFVRCLNLSKIFNKEKIFFLLKKKEINSVKIYGNNKLNFLKLNNKNIIYQNKLIEKYAIQKKCDHIITDLYTDKEIFNTKPILNFYKRLKENKNLKLLSISDIRVKDSVSDFVFIPNSLKDNLLISNKGQIIFGGLKYNFLKYEKIQRKKNSPNKFKILSIFLSAKNRNNDIKKILNGIINSDISVKLINIFTNYKFVNFNKNKFKNKKIKIEIFKLDKNFLKILSKSDMLITSEGTTKYDGLALGIITCIISYFNYKNSLIKSLLKKNFLFFLGYSREITHQDIKTKLNSLNENKLLIKKIFKKQIQNFDLKGIYRFKKILKDHKYIQYVK
jgi:spore coat polysaccharide biosynthesis predicted glycosyltransferase SpsG